MLASGVYKRGLVIGAETLSRSVDWSDRSTAVLFGDGAGGVLLEACEQPTFLAEILRTDGGRGASLTAGIDQKETPFSTQSCQQPFIQMEGRAIFEFATRDVTATMAELLEQADMTVDCVDYFLLHQANIRILDKMARKLGVAREKFPANMDKYGNTSAASLPILLSECCRERNVADWMEARLFSWLVSVEASHGNSTLTTLVNSLALGKIKIFYFTKETHIMAVFEKYRKSSLKNWVRMLKK